MDVNEDGHLDILSGSYSRHDSDMAGLFQVLYGKAGGGFAAAAVLCGTDGAPLIIAHAGRSEVTEAICTRPFAVDWDGDDDLDLVVGNFRGTFHLFRGEGAGRFAPGSELIRCAADDDDALLKSPGVHGDPFVIDWDGDGDLDLLSGSGQGGVYWARNTADGAGEPRLTAFEVLIPAGSRPQQGAFLAADQLTGPAVDTRIWVDDVDGDGKLDILVGDTVTLVAPAEGLSREECAEKQAAWQKEMDALARSATSDASAQKDRQEKVSALYARRDEFLDEQRTGFVWLYRRR